MTEWINVKTRLPEHLPEVRYSRDVLFIAEKEIMYVGTYNSYDNEWQENHCTCGCCHENPTAIWWAELPGLPK